MKKEKLLAATVRTLLGEGFRSRAKARLMVVAITTHWSCTGPLGKAILKVKG